MEPESRRQVVLAALVALLAFALYRAWPLTSATPPQSSNGTTTAATTPATRGAASSDRTPAKVEAPEVRLTTLAVERPKPAASQRNLFRFRTKVRPAPPSSQASGGPRGPGAAPVGPVAPAGPPPITLKFIGVVERREKAERIAVLRDTVGHIFYGGEGEVVEGRYRIMRIGVESIEMAYLDGRGRQTIRLTGS